MCIFSQSIEDVSNTSIFARVEDNHQYLVYRMSYRAANELAMVLPIPVQQGGSENSFCFINLQQYPYFFDDMLTGFPTRFGCFSTELSKPDLGAPVPVHDVGDFEASFVPQIKDFTRLDPRFRLDGKLWDKLPEYRDYGFAVFKLKPTSQEKYVHPMAFRFPTRLKNAIYFPTLHIHDGKLPQMAEFDHVLFCQFDETKDVDSSGWSRSPDVASKFMEIPKSSGIIDGDQPCWFKGLEGELENKDTFLIATEI